ncbi:non-specific lipid-transfer protein A-like [Malania oleifera]|uniref:non-specific lipid-transfer protein A-like n=1 Tax=Malania oleifera TaxID=397392 RepID=UPI0025ADE5D7|nr:non-specific lipid-transfer protein A-like [Malania oleifera]
MKGGGVLSVLVAVLVAMAVAVMAAELGHGAVTCGQVNFSLAACLPYLTAGGAPSPACCKGVVSLKGLARTTDDKRAACKCIKEAASHYPSIKEDVAAALPAKCGVSIDIPISTRTNCDIIH